MAKNIQSLLPYVQAAVTQYDMIKDGDHVAVGVSGGKDSLVLLTLLARLRQFYTASFSLTAITLDPQFDGPGDFSEVEELCKKLDVPYVLKRTHLWEAVVSEGQMEHPCSLCAKMRRGALHKTAVDEGCNVVALGHHADDAAETFWMNLVSGGTFSCFSPKAELDRRQITLIRPMIYLREKDIEVVSKNEGLPIVRSACPANGVTSRENAKKQLETFSKEHGKDMTTQIINGLKKANISGW